MVLNVKVYKMLGASPAPSSDYYLGDATYMGADVYNFQLPPTDVDFQFYYLATDTAGNSSWSSVYTYFNGQSALMWKTTTPDDWAGFRFEEGLVNLRL